MPIEHWIEKDRHRVRAVVTGEFTNDEIFQAIRASVEDPEFRAGFDILSDHTQIGTPITTQQAEALSSYLRGFSKYFAGSRWAVVTTKPASYGMMRMLSVFVEKVPMSLQVFKTVSEAETWLATPKEAKSSGHG